MIIFTTSGNIGDIKLKWIYTKTIPGRGSQSLAYKKPGGENIFLIKLQ